MSSITVLTMRRKVVRQVPSVSSFAIVSHISPFLSTEKALHHKFAVNSSESHHPPFLSFDRSRGELLLRCSPPVVDCVLAFMYQGVYVLANSVCRVACSNTKLVPLDRFQLPNGETERVPELIRCVDALQMDDLMYLLLKKYGTKFVQHSLHSENKVQQCYAPVAAPQTLSAHVRKLYCEPSIMAERTADVWLAVAIKGGPQLKVRAAMDYVNGIASQMEHYSAITDVHCRKFRVIACF